MFSPQTIVGTSNNANGGAGGPPVGAVHSGNFSPVVPVGGGSVFGNDPEHLKGTKTKTKKESKTKAHVVIRSPAKHVVQKANVRCGTGGKSSRRNIPFVTSVERNSS